MIENVGARIFRRKRKFQGATWTPDSISSLKEDGVWCPLHKMRHGYKSNRLGIHYHKKTNGKFSILWYCKETGNVLLEQELNHD